MKDPAAKIEAIKTAAKFFSEDKERGFEAKVYFIIFPKQFSGLKP